MVRFFKEMVCRDRALEASFTRVFEMNFKMFGLFTIFFLLEKLLEWLTTSLNDSQTTMQAPNKCFNRRKVR